MQTWYVDYAVVDRESKFRQKKLFKAGRYRHTYVPGSNKIFF